jgi:multiple sugar transport system substrate-binding protein
MDNTKTTTGISQTTRRAFLKSSLAVGAASVGVAGLLPAGVLAQSDVAGTIRFSIWFGAGDIEVWQKVIADFEAANPAIKVEFEPVAYEEFYTKLNTQLASGSAPDVIGMQFQSRVWGPKGIVEPLDGYLAPEDIASIPASLLLTTQAPADGGTKQYGLPWRMVGGSLFGNLTAMQAAGIAYPDSWTIDDFVKAAQALTSDSQWGTAVVGASLSTNLATAFGARPTSPDYSKALFNSPEMHAFVQWQHDLIYKLKVAPVPQDLSKQKEPFASGTVALFPSASWMYPAYRQITDFDWDILPDPSGVAEPKTYAGPDNLAITAGSKNKDAAWAFLKHAVLSREAQTPISSTGMPVLIDYLTDADRVAAEAAKKPAHYGYFVDGVVNRGEGWAFAPEFSTIIKHVTDAYELIMNDENPDIDGILNRTNGLIEQALQA